MASTYRSIGSQNVEEHRNIASTIQTELQTLDGTTGTLASAEETGNLLTGDAHDEKALAPPALPRLRYVMLMTGVALGLFLSMLDSSIVATSLFTIAVEFRDVERINWVALAYTLTFLSCAVLFARVSDIVGRRVAFLAAYVLFVAFSLACGFSRNMPQLIAFRALQGLGGSGLYSLSMVIMPELTPDHSKRFIAAIVGIVIASAGVLGPVLGGILTEYTGWRWVFWINGPIGGVSTVVFLLAWPDKKYLPSLERRAWKEVDFVGAFLLIAAAVLIVFPFQNSSGAAQWSQPTFIAPVVAGIVALLALFAWQYFVEYHWRRKLAAAFPFVLLSNRVYAFAVLHTMLTGFPFLLSIYAFPLRFQVVYGRSTLQAGLMLLPMLAASAIGTTLAGAINGKQNRLFETLVTACLLMIMGCALETTASSDGGLEPKVLGFLVFIGLGYGLSASGSTMLAGLEAPIWEHASAQGIIAQVRILGGSIGIAASSAVLGAKTRGELGDGSVSPELLAHLASDPASFSPEQWAGIRRVYTDALREDMIVCCAVLAAAVVCTLGIYRRGRVSIEEMLKQRHRAEGERRRAADVS
ncbi:hypothetical protein VTK56DRAFT_4129 [Thermocarpiscus australiensis]